MQTNKCIDIRSTDPEIKEKQFKKMNQKDEKHKGIKVEDWSAKTPDEFVNLCASYPDVLLYWSAPFSKCGMCESYEKQVLPFVKHPKIVKVRYDEKMFQPLKVLRDPQHKKNSWAIQAFPEFMLIRNKKVVKEQYPFSKSPADRITQMQAWINSKSDVK